jgi:preprotein translocase subunit SecE
MNKIQQYLNEVVGELKKVTWPTAEELKSSTTIVIFFSIIMSFFVWFSDLSINKLMDLILGA